MNQHVSLMMDRPNGRSVMLRTLKSLAAVAAIGSAMILAPLTAGAIPSAEAAPEAPPASEAAVAADAPSASLTLKTTASPEIAQRFDAGATLAYSFVVTNTGDVPVENLAVSNQAFNGSNPLTNATCPVTLLAPSATATCAASYVLTQTDVDKGGVSVTAHASGTPADANTSVVSPADTLLVTIPQLPSLELMKSATPNVVTHLGQQISYFFKVINTGNVTLRDVAVQESSFTGWGGPLSITCPAGAASLAPAAAVTCTANYVVVPTDMDAGAVNANAIAYGTAPGAETPTASAASAFLGVDIPQHVVLSVVTSASPGKVARAGEVITYSYLVTNTGNVTIADAMVEDSAFTGAGARPQITCPVTAYMMAPGASVTCTSTYTVVQADVDAGSITSRATTTARGPGMEVPRSPIPANVLVVETSTAAPHPGSAAASGPGVPAAKSTSEALANTGLTTGPFAVAGLLTLLVGASVRLASRTRRLHRV